MTMPQSDTLADVKPRRQSTEQDVLALYDDIARAGHDAAGVQHRFKTPWDRTASRGFLGSGVLASLRDRRVLDAGCGVGTHLRELVSEGARPFGLDLSGESLAHARVHAPGVPLTQGSVRALPYRSEAFEATVCLGVLCYVADDACATALSELARVTSTGGELLVHIKNRRSITGVGAAMKRRYRAWRGQSGATMYFRTTGWYRRRLPSHLRILGAWGQNVFPAKWASTAALDRWLLARVPALSAFSADLFLRISVSSASSVDHTG